MKKLVQYDWNDCMIRINMNESQEKVILLNPTDLRKVSVQDVCNRLLSTLEKFEFEQWVAEQICAVALTANINGRKEADLTRISEANLHYYYEHGQKENILVSKYFKEKFVSLPIFRVIAKTEKEITLEFIPM